MEIAKSGDQMELLRGAVIHSLQKEAHANTAEIKWAQKTLNPCDDMVLKLAEQLADLVGKDGNSVLWGQFQRASRQGDFPGAVSGLIDPNDDTSLMGLSKVAMIELRDQARFKPGATGGHIFFGHYQRQGKDYLLVAMIKQKGAITLTPDMRPTAIKEIDMSKLHQAARINLDRFRDHLATETVMTSTSSEFSSPTGTAASGKSSGSNTSDTAIEKTYLCFVNRKGREEVADYFIDALGCRKGTSSSQMTTGLLRSLRNFVRSRPNISHAQVEIKQGVVDYMQSLPEDMPLVRLDEVVQAARAKVAPQLHSEFDDLKSYLNSEAQGIHAEFTLSRAALKAHIRINAKKSNWGLWFETSAVGTQNSELLYSVERKTLTLTSLPTDTVEGIEETLRARGQM
ncbi:nucleoid-associated protein [Stenotrophomonas maltophilia]|uniref:nucleoid-associated protein n=1 Tax=Stenotrophomonas maltophilia TaxID=40324 RepID=UPI0021000F19|nr:nucleoid-associated protein [Stenotrophomonas maltophilia]